MADTTTPVYGYTSPEVGASSDSWGSKLNANWLKTDNLLGGTIPVTGIDINSGSIDGTAIGAATPAAVTTTALIATTADINGGTIDGTIIGGVVAAGGTFTGLVATTVDINAGTVDGTQIGATSASTVVGTTITGTNLIGPLAGHVTGNVTGNTAGVHTGAVSGDVAGNVTTTTGTSSFNHVTIVGSLDMDAGTSATITGLSTPVQASDAATKSYVDTAVANLIDNAPANLDTLNELAAALGDDEAFATTIAASVATKLPKSGGTMSGAIAMGTNKITGLGTPTAGTDAATKSYADGVDAQKLDKSGGTMSGVIAMGANKITGVADPTTAQDASTKNYTDTLFGSTADAATSAAAAATSEGNAATSATSAGNSATSAAASWDLFHDQYLGSKASNPTTDNDGNALVVGALYFNATANSMRVYNGSSWADAGSAVNGTSNRVVYTATAGQTSFTVTYDAGFADVYLNGIKLEATVDFASTSGTAIVLTTGATVGDIVDIVAYGAFNVADTYTQAAADSKFALIATTTVANDALPKTGGAMTGAITTNSTFDGVDIATRDAILTSTTTTAGAALPKAGGTLSGTIVAADNIIQGPVLKDYAETKVAMAANDVDLALGNVQTKTISGSQTLTFTNPPASGSAGSFTLLLTNGGSATVTWPTSVDWPVATAPTLTAAGLDILVFTTIDGGTIWYGIASGIGMA